MSRPRAPLASINVTPLVDVLLILVATLLLLAPQLVKQLPVDLPQVAVDGRVRPQHSILITIDALGGLSIEEQPMSVKDVLARVDHTTTVEIAASGQVAYKEITRLVEALKEQGVREVQLVVR